MIKSFRDKATKAVVDGEPSKLFANIDHVARRKLDMIDAAHVLNDLRVPPGNRLEALKGDRTGQYSIRINDKWRICFAWSDDGPTDVEIVDYH
jgi:toxin HigB-1